MVYVYLWGIIARIMKLFTPRISRVVLLLFVSVAFGIWGCARMVAPEGGPYDMIPPQPQRAVPASGSTNFTGKNIRIYFDENIKLVQQSEKVFISPPQQNPPKMVAVGRYINIRLEDPLLPNTTYTIDFSDAIVDNNEGNPLEGFTYSFSTGNRIDSMCLSGVVLDERTLAPLYGVLVGVYPSQEQGTVSFRDPMQRVSKSLTDGSFEITNLAPGAYNVLALVDLDRSYSYSIPQERFAYLPKAVSAVEPAPVALDTVNDSAQRVEASNNVHTLLLSRGPRATLLLNKLERTGNLQLSTSFSAPLDTLPVLQVDEPTIFKGKPVYPQLSEDAKSVVYFLPPVLGTNTIDSLQVQVSYPTVDSLGMRIHKQERRTLYKPRQQTLIRGSQNKQFAAQSTSSQETSSTVGTKLSLAKNLDPKTMSAALDTLASKTDSALWAPISLTSATNIYKGTMRDTLRATFEEPITHIDTSAIRLFEIVNDEKRRIPYVAQIERYKSCNMRFDASLELGKQYLLQLDSAAITGLYGLKSLPTTLEVAMAQESDLANLELTLVNFKSTHPVLVELLSSEDTPILSTWVQGDSLVARFTQLPAGTYYARLFVDVNHNGAWDGALFGKHAGEPVYYYPKELSLQPRFVTQEEWHVTQLPLSKQRPTSLKAQADDELSQADQLGSQRTRPDLNEAYIQRMREKYGKKWNPSNKDRKILGLPSREEEKAAKMSGGEADELDAGKTEDSSENALNSAANSTQLPPSAATTTPVQAIHKQIQTDRPEIKTGKIEVQK